MRGLVRNHSVIRGLPKFAVIAASTASVGLNLLTFERLNATGVAGLGGEALVQVVVLLGGLTILLMKEAGRRATPWTLGLPLPARTLWRAHLQALVLAVTLLVAAMAAVMLGFAAFLERLADLEVVTPARVAPLLLRPWLVLVAAMLLLGSWRGSLADPLRAGGWGRLRLVLALGSLLVVAVLSRLPWPLVLPVVLAAAVSAWRGLRGLPPGLLLAARPAGRQADRQGGGASDGRRVLHWVVLRQLFKWPTTWIIGVPVIAALGLLLGGAASAAADAEFVRFFNIWITVYLLVAFTGYFLENLGRVDHLPVSRGLLLRWLLLPGMTALVVGALAGALLAAGGTPGEALIFDNDADGPGYGLRVPADVWEPVWGAPPATVTAPWGEEHAAVSREVVQGGRLHIWKPYATPAAASSEFVAWQLGRAVARVYGVMLPDADLAERYLTVDAAGVVQVREPGLTLVADGMVPPRGPVGPVWILVMGPTIVLALLTCWLIFVACGPGATRRRVRTAFWTAMGVLIALHLAGYVLLMTRTVLDWTVAGLVRGFAGQLGSLGTFGWLLPWLVFVPLTLACWRLCARAFDRVEAVRTRPGAGCGV